ncbi:MAG: outer membrane lipoprotein-sorting protein [Bacteroidia bacterium]|nr:outer membrane lipoprotein-sorting protein [Bacteroidia bacterium]MBT8270333.1 outer membrane lipoprotein-sorting protein [Bacteroidia bacterium]NNK69583.1 outer membrane lipoprotein-sorting protein [Flavobacteriaceae bacterium]NNL81127.1 outer membrane lipoprotein-sorting protein [Flavobacteriaceae bacterium]
MKTLQLFVVALAVSFATPMYAQTADEIINNYFENTGGEDNWRMIEGITMHAKINQGGMEIPLEITRLKNGKQMTVINLQGQVFKQGVYDGETFWGMNFQTMKAEKNDAETTANLKTQLNDFPDPFLDYKEKGYTVELMGKEEMDGTECFKIMLEMEPITVDGKEEKSISYYFFDTENFVPIVIQSEIKQGQAKGMISEVTMSDYQEVGNVYMPFSMTQGVKGQPGQPITMDKIELNPTIDDKEFMFPDDTAEEKKDDNENKN